MKAYFLSVLLAFLKPISPRASQEYGTHRGKSGALNFSHIMPRWNKGPLMFVYGIIYNGPNSEFYHIIERNTVSHHYPTRQVGELRLPRFDKTKCRHSMEYAGIRFWNLIPEVIRNAPNPNNFKRIYRNYLLNTQ